MYFQVLAISVLQIYIIIYKLIREIRENSPAKICTRAVLVSVTTARDSRNSASRCDMHTGNGHTDGKSPRLKAKFGQD